MRSGWLARLAPLWLGAVASGLAGCKPPPTDAAVTRVALGESIQEPTTPIASPDTTGAIWSATMEPARLVYRVPGKPVLLAIECVDMARPTARIRITRHATAEAGAGALLALIGNDEIGRFPVDATRVNGRMLWQGEVSALRPEWEALKQEKEATVTVPGAGLVKLNPSPLPMQLVSACRGPDAFIPDAITPDASGLPAARR